MYHLIQIMYILLALWLMAQLLYPFVTVLAGRLWGRERLQTNGLEEGPDYACIITAYKNAGIAKPLVQSLLNQTHSRYHIYLVADECPEFDFGIQDARFTLLRPNPPLRLKVKSIEYAMVRFVRPHGYTVVFDADNLAHPDFLKELNPYVRSGYRCIQGQRTAKNLDTNYAALDSLGEHYKNYLERYLPWLLGGSSVISGSGMATETTLYQAYIDSPEITQGKERWKKMLQEDKILQNFLLFQDCRIAYARRAIVYDEKVDSGSAVQTQRSRWLFSYFQNLPNAGGLLLRGILRGSWNQCYFGFVTLALPMFIQVGVAGLLVISGYWLAPQWSLALCGALCIFALTVPLILYLDEAPAPVWKALRRVPFFIWRQVLGLLKMNNPNKNFKHTEHKKYVSVEEVMQQKK